MVLISGRYLLQQAFDMADIHVICSVKYQNTETGGSGALVLYALKWLHIKNNVL
jgi:hypothetical protein